MATAKKKDFKISQTKRYRSGDDPVLRFLALDLHSDLPVVAVIGRDDGKGGTLEEVRQFTLLGEYMPGETSPIDLVEVPDSKTVWVGFYEDPSSPTGLVGKILPDAASFVDKNGKTVLSDNGTPYYSVQQFVVTKADGVVDDTVAQAGTVGVVSL